MILEDASGNGAWLLLHAGDASDAVLLAPALERLGGAVTVRKLAANEGSSALDDLLSENTRGIVLLASHGEEISAYFLALLRNLAQQPGEVPALWLVTRGAHTVELLAAPAPNAEQAALWGLGRTLALELPRLWGGLIDIPESGLDNALARSLALGIAGTHGEEQLALRGSTAFALHLVPRPPSSSGGLTCYTAGTVLVTGGLGALGLQVARWLVRSGVKDLLLLGRRGIDTPGAAEAVAKLQALEAEVRVVAADVTEREAMARVLAGVRVRAVFHLAGLADKTPLQELSSEQLQAVTRTRTKGVDVLLDLLKDRKLDAFVAFSAANGIWGGGGLGLVQLPTLRCMLEFALRVRRECRP